MRSPSSWISLPQNNYSETLTQQPAFILLGQNEIPWPYLFQESAKFIFLVEKIANS